MANWFTSVPLASDMLTNHKLTVVGTLQSDKKEMQDNKSRKLNSSMFCYNKENVLVSYKAKSNKIVYLLSNTHEKGTIS